MSSSPDKEATTMTEFAVKFVDGSDDLIRGLAIPFGGPLDGKDLDGETFTPETDFAFDLFPQGRPVLYDHGLDGAMKMTVQGRQVEHFIDAEGVWAQAQLDKAAKYHATVSRLIAAGKLFFSSGAIPHLVEVAEDGAIKRWPWTELSLTPTPANPWAAVYPVKSTAAIEHLQAAKIDIPGQLLTEALKALDKMPTDIDAPDPASLDDKAGRVTSALVEFRAHATSAAEMRTKVGRTLSAANRERIARVVASKPAVLEAYADLEELLAETDPDVGKSVTAAVIEAELTRARLLGVPIPG